MGGEISKEFIFCWQYFLAIILSIDLYLAGLENSSTCINDLEIHTIHLHSSFIY